MIPIFVGYDRREAVAYSVFCHSVLARTEAAVSFAPVTGEKRPESSTAFNYGRFLIPHLMNYRGWAIWADGDMLCRADIAELWDMKDIRCDVMVAKHDYRTKHPVKFLGQKNEDYPRKNWSSLMLINCAGAAWKRLQETEWSGPEKHRFKFLDDARIGELPLEWNWLVGEYPHTEAAKLAHFTIGTPCWQQYATCDYADEWFKDKHAMLDYQQHVAA